MKKIIVGIILAILLGVSVFMLSGCSLTIDASDNSVSASVDGDTTEKVDNILDWIKARLSRLFNSSDDTSSSESV